MPESARELLRIVEHRPWPLPDVPWVMRQTWLDLLFAHWSFDPDALRRVLPAELELDTFDGRAWLGVVPFRIADSRPRALPAIPTTGEFPELNVRTYVTRDGKPGVWFFSLDAASALAVLGARAGFGLPYFRARMRCEARDGDVEYESVRTHRGAPPAALRGRYSATGPVRSSARGSLEHWLTERYCLYTAPRRGRVRRADIHHRPWPLQPAQASIERNTMTEPLGLPLDRPPESLLFAGRLDVLIWMTRSA